jgi:hypothetical protein
MYKVEMSSVQSAYAATYRLPTKFSALITPSYNDNTIVSGQTVEIPIPFIAVNGVLDINVAQSAVIQAFVNAGTAPESNADIQGKVFGGVTLIRSFGPNMTTYLRNWINTIETLGGAYTGPLVLYIQPVMTKVQLANPVFLNSGAFKRNRSWGISTEAPVSGEYTGGGPSDNFFTAFIFKTPMTVQYVAPGGEFKYITMTTQFGEE